MLTIYGFDDTDRTTCEYMLLNATNSTLDDTSKSQLLTVFIMAVSIPVSILVCVFSCVFCLDKRR